MTNHSISKAAKNNPSLEPLSILIGEWNTVGKHPFLPNEILHGHASFQWLEGGAFLIMHSAIDHKDFPAGIAIFGSDNADDEYSMIYFDERDISRKYLSTLKDKVWTWWRNDAEFSQRFVATVNDDGNTMVSKGEMAKDGKTWEKALELTYTRVQ